MQRIDLATGAVETIVTGTTACDPIRRTAWGTIVFGEEAGNTGQLYELIDPLRHDRRDAGPDDRRVQRRHEPAEPGATRRARSPVVRGARVCWPTASCTTATSCGPRTARPVVRTTSSFPPPRSRASAPITQLADSPLASGSVFALKVGRRSGGNTTSGRATTRASARGCRCAAASARCRRRATNVDLGAFATSQPADRLLPARGPRDRPGHAAVGQGPALRQQHRQRGQRPHFGETVCITDGTVASRWPNTAIPTVQYFVVGNPQFAMMDNLALQPGFGTTG